MARVLIVDDSAFQRKVLSDMVKDIGHEVLEAATGDEAIKVISYSEVDLVCLDLLMPGLSGVEVLRYYHKKEGIPPFVVISANIQKKKKEECLSLGAVSFINKYIKKEELEESLNKHLK